MEHGISWASLLLGGVQTTLERFGVDPVAGTNALVVAGVLVLFAYVAGRKFRSNRRVVPEGRHDLGHVTEFGLTRLFGLFDELIPHGAPRFYALLGTFTFVILGNNLIGLVPGFQPPTDQYSVTLALALITFVAAHYTGLRIHGLAYVRKFIGPVWWLSWMIFPLELITHLVRPLSLSMRLFGNMTGDHQVVLVFSTLLALGLPIPFMGLGLFVAILQTFVFVLLSSVYFQEAMEKAH